MVSGPNVRTSLEKLLEDNRTRLTLLERRMAVGGGGGGAVTLLPGEIEEFPDKVLPAGYLWTDGRAVSRTTYSELFAKIGTTYGAGDGSTTFNLPNLNGKRYEFPTLVSDIILTDCFQDTAGTADTSPDSYEVRGLLFPNANSYLDFRFQSNGVDEAGAVYVFTRSDINNGAVSSNIQSAQDRFFTAPSQFPIHKIRMTVMNVGRATWTEVFYEVANRNGPAVAVNRTDAAGHVMSDLRMDGLHFFASGNTFRGWIEVIPSGGSMVPSAIRYQTQVLGGGGAGSNAPAPGVIQAYAGVGLPSGALWCDGSAVSRTTYAALFATIGTAYGVGDGSTTFNVPNLVGRMPIGKWDGDADFTPLGKTGGSKTHTHFEGTLATAGGASNGDTGSYSYEAVGVRPDGRGPTTVTSYTVTGGGLGSSRTFNHYSKVYGTTAASNGMPMYTITNYIIWTGLGTGQVPAVPVSGWGKGTTAERDGTYGVPATDAQRVALANSVPVWFNTEKNWEESYYTTSDKPGLTVPGIIATGGFSSGWYPTRSGALYTHRGKTDGFQSITATPVEVALSGTSQASRGGFSNGAFSATTVPLGGMYRLSCRVYTSGAAAAYVNADMRVNGASNGTVASTPKPGGEDQRAFSSRIFPVTAGSVITLWASAAASTSVWGTDGYNGTFLEVEYLGPPLVNS